ncbi:MAG TPA: M28 family peptidase [Blastocatellia bacterium]|nr:M28 family peptidase [Blastocatellia bacterium]
MFKRRVNRIIVVVAFLSLAVTAIQGGTLPLPSPAATSSITAASLKRHLSFLASDELGGRYTLSPSNRIAARYLASQLEYYGFRGAAPHGAFFQKVPLVFQQVNLGVSKLVLTQGDSRREFKYGDDFGQQLPLTFSANGGLVFAGYGVSSPEHGYDDYAKVDTKGKIVVELFGLPQALRRVKLPAEEKEEAAAKAHGAVAVIVITPKNYLSAWANIKNVMLLSDQPSLPPRPGQSAGSHPIFAGAELIKALASAIGVDAGFLEATGGKPVEPKTLQATAQISVQVDTKDAAPAQNVVGILDGSDPVLKDQYVMFSAHYDHLKTSDSGQIYNGADDDGSGTASVLEIAKACAMERPKRSILIVFHTGEELGLFGSEYNTDYSPVVPLKDIVADFNIDMIGRSRPAGDDDVRDAHLTDERSIYIIGADKLSSELNKISEQTDEVTARMRFDYTYNNDNDPERFYYRSDHYNYAKHGIPIIFYFTGVHRDYHEPSDKVDKIDFPKMERIARMVFATGWRVANLDHRLAVDKKPEPDDDGAN